MNTLIALRSTESVLTFVRNAFIALSLITVFLIVFFGVLMIIDNAEVKHFAHVGFSIFGVAVLSEVARTFIATCLSKLGN